MYALNSDEPVKISVNIYANFYVLGLFKFNEYETKRSTTAK